MALLCIILPQFIFAQQTNNEVFQGNLAVIANTAGSGRFPTSGLNDELTPTPRQTNNRRPLVTNTTQWVQYEWKQPVSTNGITLFWWNYNGLAHLPQAYRIKYWDGQSFVAVKNASGFGLQNRQFNSTSFDEVKTTRLRLEIDSAEKNVVT